MAKTIEMIEINDLGSLEKLLTRDDLADEQYVHWQNGTNPQEAYLRIQNLNGKRAVCHYDVDGRNIIMPMRELIEKTLGAKPIDVSGLERVGAGLFNPGGFAADQPIFADRDERRAYAKNKLEGLPLNLIEAAAAKAVTATAATEFAKGGKAPSFFGRKPQAAPAAEPQITNESTTPKIGRKD